MSSLIIPSAPMAGVPPFRPAMGITSARLEMLRAAEWICRVSVKTERGWVSPVPFRFQLRDGTFSCWVGA